MAAGPITRDLQPLAGRSVARHLLMFGAALLLPMLALVALLTWYAGSQGRARAELEVEEAAIAAVAALDRETVAYQSMLAALLTAPTLEAGDLAGFHRRAKRLAEQEKIVISLRARDGRQLLRTDRAYGTSLPPKSLAIDQWVIAERQPGVSDLELDGKRNGHVSVVVPVLKGGRTETLLTATIPTERLADALRRVLPSTFWAGTVADRNGIMAARTRNHSNWVGRPITPAFKEAAFTRQQGTWEGPSHEGQPLLGGFARSSQSGWLVGVGVDRNALEESTGLPFPLLMGGAVLVALFGSVLALASAREIVQPLETLAGNAHDLADGRPVEPLKSGIREVDAVSAALAGAAAALDERDAELRGALASLEEGNADLEREVQRRSKEAEDALARLFQSQKMESIGRLTGGVAHDFNNLLTPIVSCLDLLHRQHEDDRSRRLIDGAMASAERAAALVRHLLAFARRQTLDPRPVSPALLMGRMQDLLERSLGTNIQMLVDVPEDLPAALADSNQLELALLNLAVNARDAMPGGGQLAIVVREVPVDEGEVPGLAAGRYIRFRVKDTGHGMDEETLRKAHEPFFTTKEIGKGTGLGLSMVHGIAAQSNGAFRLRSKLGGGTTAFLWLPAVDAPVSASSETERNARKAERDATVLLVDDDARVRGSAAEELRELGYAVTEMASAEEALEVVRSGSPFDIMVTDQAMPGMTGLQLASELRQLRPGIPVLLVTGFTDLEPGDNIQLLAKPFRHADLANAVAGLLQAPTEA